MVSFRIVLHVRPEKRAEFRSAVSAIIDRAVCRHGCVGGRLTADCDDTDGYFLTLEWEGRDPFNEFLKSKEMSVVTGMRGLLDAEPRSIVDEVLSRKDSPLPATINESLAGG